MAVLWQAVQVIARLCLVAADFTWRQVGYSIEVASVHEGGDPLKRG